MEVGDNIFMGNFTGPQGLSLVPTSHSDPTRQNGVGPMGRIYVYDIVPLVGGPTTLGIAQTIIAGTPLALRVGNSSVTAQPAPDGSGRTVYAFDVPRNASLTSTANMSTYNFTFSGFDYLGRPTTQTLAGPNANTVVTLKAFASVLSVVSDTTDGTNTVSVGINNSFGLPYAVTDAGYIASVSWNNVLARNTGTLTVADATSPATGATGDPRGTYLPSSAPSNTARLVIGILLTGAQCGSSPNVTALLGVPPA